MDSRCCAYSFLTEKSLCCDYEIMTDQLASDIALASHDVKACDELLQLCELVYHCNGSIRGKFAIEEKDLLWLNEVYEKYLALNGETRMFVVPAGSKGACWLHHLRVEAKQCVRLAYRIEQEGIAVKQRLLDFLNLLSNVFFQMALYENKQNNIQEVPFHSKSYAG